MSRLISGPWFARPNLLQRGRHIVAVMTRNEMGWVMEQTGPPRPHRFWWRGDKAIPPATPTGAERLRTTLGELGGAFVKLGQILSTRPNLLPPEKIRQVIIEELRSPPEELFASFDHPTHRMCLHRPGALRSSAIVGDNCRGGSPRVGRGSA